MDDIGEADVRRLAALHAVSLRGSLISKAGQRGVRAFYRFVLRSRDESLVVVREAGEIVAAGVVSVSPRTLEKRLLQSTAVPGHLLFQSPGTALAAIGRTLLGDRSGAGWADGIDNRIPELIIAFTAPEHRNAGHGADLIRRCDKLVREMGFVGYDVKTVNEPDNGAARFYEANGFRQVSSPGEAGAEFVVFHKDLT